MNNKFKANLLTLSVVSVLTTNPIALFAAEQDIAEAVIPQKSANKQEQADETEIINVTGIRSSQKMALFTKREAASIMDSIAAEDIGKFPDQNISESLQRIPGITVERKGGEGQFITVRGLGPAHSAVLLNGRVLATENDGREFSFDVLASELISGADVFKAPSAHLQEGGIGSTVNLKTLRPLDLDGFKAVASVKAHYDESSGETTPQASGLISNTFVDGTVGVLASLNYSDRKFRTERGYTDGYEKLSLDRFNGLSDERRAELAVDSGVMANDGSISMPTYYTQDVDQSTRERIGGTVAAQWQATEDLLFTLDTVYSKLDVNSDTNGVAWGGGPDQVSEIDVDGTGTATNFAYALGARPTELVAFSRPRFAKTQQYGFNAQWLVSDRLTAVFDTSYSKAQDTITGNQSYFASLIENPDRALTFSKQAGELLPTYTNFGDLTQLDNIKPGFATFEGRDVTDEVYQSSVDVTYDFGYTMLTSVQAGASYINREKTRYVAKTPDNVLCAYCNSYGPGGYTGAVPSNIVSLFDASGFISGASDTALTTWPSYTVADMLAFMTSDAGLAGITDENKRAEATAALAANNGFTVEPKPQDSGSVEEETVSVYVQANLEGSVSDMPWSGNLGLRYSQTDVASNGTARTILALTPVPGLNEVIVDLSEPVAITESGDYDILLPTANFKLEVQDDLVMRLSAGKTITRPTLTDLMLNKSYNVRPTERNVQSGNPSLKPLIAWNYDISLTWYIDDVSYLNAVYFYKDLSNETIRETSIIQIQGFDFFSNMPINKGEGEIQGYELAAQYTFSQLPAPFDGFGLMANYTDVGEEKDNNKSVSYNLGGFYEKGPLQARVAYNFREGYENSSAANRGQPSNFSDYGQWDASASYDINDNLTAFVEGVNLSDEQTLQYSIYEARLIELKDTGRRFAVGVRYSF